MSSFIYNGVGLLTLRQLVLLTCSASSPGRQLKDSSSSRCFLSLSWVARSRSTSSCSAASSWRSRHAPLEAARGVRVFKRHPRHRAGFFLVSLGIEVPMTENDSSWESEATISIRPGRELGQSKQRPRTDIRSFVQTFIPCPLNKPRRLPVNRAP